MAHSAASQLHTQPGKSKTVADILTAAADLIEPEGKWTQDAFARNDLGDDEDEVPPDEFDPVCFCVMGAINVARGARVDAAIPSVIVEPIKQAAGIDSDLAWWNDHPTRTQADVVAALRAAAEKARTAAEAHSVGTDGREATGSAPNPSTPGTENAGE